MPLCWSSDDTARKFPVGGELWIFVTDPGQLIQFLTALVVPHKFDAESAADWKKNERTPF